MSAPVSFPETLEHCKITKRRIEINRHFVTDRIYVKINPGTNLTHRHVTCDDMHLVYEHLMAKHIRNCPPELYFKTMITTPYIDQKHNTEGAVYEVRYRNIGKCDEPLVTFENDFCVETTDVTTNTIATIIIDGWPDDENAPGIAVCSVALTKHGNFKIDTLNRNYVKRPEVIKLIQQSEQDLLELFGDKIQ